MKIVNLEPDGFSSVAVEELGRIGEYESLPAGSTYGSEAFRAAVAEADVLWTRLAFRVDVDLLGMSPRARFVVTPTTGLTHVDREALERAGVELLSLAGEGSFLDSITATAELSWLLVLALQRRLLPAVFDVRAGRWDRDRWRGRQLAGRRLGIIGMGRLGRMVAEYGRSFRMEVVHSDPSHVDPIAGSNPVALDELLASADVVSLHASLNARNVGLIGGRELGLLRDGAMLVNTARGELVDEDALLETLRSGRLGGVATDVLADEVTVTAFGVHEHPLVTYARSHDDLLITPHLGGACTDAMEATEVHMARKLLDRLSEGSS